jgi:hypothetical protein
MLLCLIDFSMKLFFDEKEKKWHMRNITNKNDKKTV